MRRTLVLVLIVEALFLVWQGYFILSQQTAPFIDEGIYVTSGLRNLEGLGYADGYLIWFAGSLLWPTLAGLGWTVAGIIGVRVLAMAFVTMAYVFAVDAANQLYGEKVGFWTAVALAANGPLLFMAHLGVYDTPALFGIALSFWAITKLIRSNHRQWLVVTAVAYSFAFVAKYPSGLMLVPLFGILLTRRGEKWKVDVGLFLFMFTGILLSVMIPVQDQAGRWLAWSSANKPTFGSWRGLIQYFAIYYGGVPFALAFFGFIIKVRRDATSWILLGTLLIWPLYHIISANPVSDNKHYIFGFVFAYPLAGVFLNWLWQRQTLKPAVVVLCGALLLVGGIQSHGLSFSWPDTRPITAFLQAHMRPGESLVLADKWPITAQLYADGLVTEMGSVSDPYTLPADPCQPWFMDANWGQPWPQDFMDQVIQCGYRQVLQYRSTITTVFGEQTVLLTLWRIGPLEADVPEY